MSQTSSTRLQDAIEAVESLTPEDQAVLIEIIRNRLVEPRRAEIISDVKEAREAYARGEVSRGIVGELLENLSSQLSTPCP